MPSETWKQTSKFSLLEQPTLLSPCGCCSVSAHACMGDQFSDTNRAYRRRQLASFLLNMATLMCLDRTLMPEKEETRATVAHLTKDPQNEQEK